MSESKSTILPESKNKNTTIRALEYLTLHTYYNLSQDMNLYSSILEKRLWVKLTEEEEAFKQLAKEHWPRIVRLILENEYNDIQQILESLAEDEYRHESYENLKKRIEQLVPALSAEQLNLAHEEALQSMQKILFELFQNKLQKKVMMEKIASSKEEEEKKSFESRLAVLECYEFDEKHADRLMDLIFPTKAMPSARQIMARHSQEFYELIEKYQSPQYNMFSKELIGHSKQLESDFSDLNKKKSKLLEEKKNEGIKIKNKDKIMRSINVGDTEFSVNEQRALTALVILIDRALSRNEIEFINKANKAFLKVKTTEYYEAFGLTKIPKGKDKKLRYSGGDVEQAKLGLFELMEKWFMIQYTEQSEENNKRKTIEHKYAAPLISASSVEQIKEEEVDLKTKQSRVIENGYLNLFVDRVFFNGLDKKFFFIPAEMNKEIRKALKGKRSPSPAIGHFVKYLHYLRSNLKGGRSNNKTEVTYTKLIEILHLRNYHKQGKRKRINDRINECFEVGQKLGLLNRVELDVTAHGYPKYILYFH